MNPNCDKTVKNIINDKLFDYYSTPGKLFKLIKLSQEYNIDLANFDLNTTITTMIKDKIYPKTRDFPMSYNEDITLSIETIKIIGATSMNQLKENIDSINLKLSKEIIAEINSVNEKIPNPAP